MWDGSLQAEKRESWLRAVCSWISRSTWCCSALVIWRSLYTCRRGGRPSLSPTLSFRKNVCVGGRPVLAHHEREGEARGPVTGLEDHADPAIVVQQPAQLKILHTPACMHVCVGGSCSLGL